MHRQTHNLCLKHNYTLKAYEIYSIPIIFEGSRDCSERVFALHMTVGSYLPFTGTTQDFIP